MISSTQNRQQNTAFGAKTYPEFVVKELKKTDVKFTTVSDYALDVAKRLDGAHPNDKDLAALRTKGKNAILEEDDLKELKGLPRAKQQVGKLIEIFSKVKEATNASLLEVVSLLHTRAKAQVEISMAEEELGKTLAKPE